MRDERTTTELRAEDYPAWLEAALGMMRFVFGDADKAEVCFKRFMILRGRHFGEHRQEFGLTVQMQAERAILTACKRGSKDAEGEFGMLAVASAWLYPDSALSKMGLVDIQTRYGIKDKKKYNERGKQTERASMHARRRCWEQMLKAGGFLGFKAPGGKSAGACETYSEVQQGNGSRLGAVSKWSDEE